jgi:hypothetical protein
MLIFFFFFFNFLTNTLFSAKTPPNPTFRPLFRLQNPPQRQFSHKNHPFPTIWHCLLLFYVFFLVLFSFFIFFIFFQFSKTSLSRPIYLPNRHFDHFFGSKSPQNPIFRLYFTKFGRIDTVCCLFRAVPSLPPPHPAAAAAARGMRCCRRSARAPSCAR